MGRAISTLDHGPDPMNATPRRTRSAGPTVGERLTALETEIPHLHDKIDEVRSTVDTRCTAIDRSITGMAGDLKAVATRIAQQDGGARVLRGGWTVLVGTGALIGTLVGIAATLGPGLLHLAR